MLIGTANGGRAVLVILAIAIATYAAWRFWEGAVGQGYDDTFSNVKNFFKFRYTFSSRLHLDVHLSIPQIGSDIWIL